MMTSAQFAAIALTFGLLVLALWLLRRKGLVQMGRARGGKLLEVLESRVLGPGHALHLVRVADRVIALATHSGGCTLLETRPWDEVRQKASPEVQT
jgi:flagellar biogenesis protein FliO